MSVPCGVSIICFRHLEDYTKNPAILLGKRKNAHGAGEYSFPGGRLEPYESIEKCASRELEEETGIVILPEEMNIWISCPFTNTIAGGEPWVTLYFFVRLLKGHKPRVMEPEKCEGWFFYRLDNLPKPLFGPAAECARQSGWIDLGGE